MKLLIAGNLIVLGYVCCLPAGEACSRISRIDVTTSVCVLGLVPNGQPANPPLARQPWWDDQTAGWVGGWVGSLVGCLGGLIGTLMGLGKARRLVLGLMTTICTAGVMSLIAGLVALLQRQPYCVWYPLLLLGMLCPALFGGLIPVARHGYQQRELQKIAAMDAAAEVSRPNRTT